MKQLSDLNAVHATIFSMTNCTDDAIVAARKCVAVEHQPIFVFRFCRVSQWVVYGHIMPDSQQSVYHIDDLAVAQIGYIFLKRQTHYQD